jgi:hypothetical protein
VGRGGGSADHVYVIHTEPRFLKILKCNLVEIASAGFQFNCLDFF